jgi:hypothetical protein
MKRWVATIFSFLILFGLTTTAAADPPWIFGMHDPGGAAEMVAKGKTGWIVFTEAIGNNPNDWNGKNYPQDALRNWYNEYYPGVTLEFRPVP